MQYREKSKGILLIISFYIILGLVSLYRHHNIESFTFRSEIWADRAGYYIYLPATFIYGYSPKEFPIGIAEKTGNGFLINYNSEKIITKYTYGVALLQMPFFLAADFITFITNKSLRNGFSIYYYKSLIFAAVFYLVIGLWLLFLSLKVYFKFSNQIIFSALILLFFGTNLYYYSIMEVGMSHVYSFFLFSLIIYLITHQPRFKTKSYFNFFLAVISALIVLIRPTNILFLPIILFWDVQSKKQFLLKVREFASIKNVTMWIIIFFLGFLPQFIYWKYAYGHFISYSYKGESFSNLFSPHFLEVLFSPENGIFPYSLILFVVLFGIIIQIWNKKALGIFSAILFILVSYLTASWYNWQFGCSCGMRNLVEYYSLLVFPLAFVFNRIICLNRKPLKWFFLIFIGILVMINFKVNYHYFGCYFSGTWGWADYLSTLLYPLKT